MDENILSRILNGEASSEEKAIFFENLGKDQNEEDIYYQVKSLWLRMTMHKTKVNVVSEFDELWQKIQKKEPRSIPLYRKIIQYAAIVVILLGLGGLTGYLITSTQLADDLSTTQHYTSMKGSVSTIEFADGTKVWLNSDSKLSYRFDKKRGKRLAELSGEAYFEVTHSDKYPFLVKTSQLTIRDLGTTFNIKAYPDDNFIETSLVEGKVDILNTKDKPLLSMVPGESATYYPNENKLETKSLAMNVLSGWRKGKFVIRDQQLEDILKEISRWYDIQFQFEKENLRDLRFTGLFKKSTSLQNVMNIMKQASDFNYRIVEKADEPDLVVIY